MIKIKILNPTGNKLINNFSDRNKDGFHMFYKLKDQLRDYSIDITDSDDYDYLFVGMDDFIDKSVSLSYSIESGLENLSKIDGDYFLFDFSDSTSLMGSYEIFEKSKAHYLFKNQLLKNREDYNKPSAFGKWFFGDGSDLDLSYNIPKDKWDRIKLTGWNLGYYNPDYFNFQNITVNKDVDLCAIYQAKHKYNEDHMIRNDIHYTNHREGAWLELDKLKSKYNIKKDKLPFNEYIDTLSRSKLSLSPFGMGEVCFRDFEIMAIGSVLLKPDMSDIITMPNVYIEDTTYLPLKVDWSDLNDKVEYAIENYDMLSEKMISSFRKIFEGKYKIENLCMYWYSIFNNMDGVNTYEDEYNYGYLGHTENTNVDGIRTKLTWDQIPVDEKKLFEMDGKVQVNIFHAGGGEGNLPFWYKHMVDQNIVKAKNRESMNYGETDLWLYKCLDKYPIDGKSVAIVGSETPAYEAICLAYGGIPTTIEYQELKSDDDRLTLMTVDEYNDNPKRFDVVISISSIEHDGLGRYGDPIDPDGDLKAMKNIKEKMIYPGGLLFLAVPYGFDKIEFNAHRVYGEVRFPKLIEGFELLHREGDPGKSWIIDKSTGKALKSSRVQPVFVLKAN